VPLTDASMSVRGLSKKVQPAVVNLTPAVWASMLNKVQPAQKESDIADIIAGELQISRAHAYDKMRSALAAAQPAQGDSIQKMLDQALALQAVWNKAGADYDAAQSKPEPAQGEVDWAAVGRIIDAHNSRGPLMAGTSNWGAMIYRTALLQSNAERVPLTRNKKQAMWVAATIDLPSQENCYLRGIVDAENAHNITKGQQ
jgi:hypothetical protein